MSKEELVQKLSEMSGGAATADQLRKFNWRDLALAYESLTIREWAKTRVLTPNKAYSN